MGGTRRTISLEQLNNFEIDADRQLYWDGEPVITMSKFSIPWWINASIVATGISAVIALILDVLTKFHVLA